MDDVKRVLRSTPASLFLIGNIIGRTEAPFNNFQTSEQGVAWFKKFTDARSFSVSDSPEHRHQQNI